MSHKESRFELADPIEVKILGRIPREIILLSFLLSVFAVFLFDALTGLFVLAGGAFSAVNFIWLKKSLSQFLLTGKKKAVKSATGFYLLRLLLILAIFFIIIFFFSRKIFAFIAGFSTIIPVFLAEAVFTLSRIKKWKH